jgi:molybdenum-dependent DNA-binding transcriptional regulator ModE
VSPRPEGVSRAARQRQQGGKEEGKASWTEVAKQSMRAEGFSRKRVGGDEREMDEWNFIVSHPPKV